MGMVSGKVNGPSVGAGRSRYLQRRLHEKEGAAAWAALALGVLLYDIYAIKHKRETMSICFGRWLRTKRGRVICGAFWTALTCHLFWSIPLPGQHKLHAILDPCQRCARLRIANVHLVPESGVVTTIRDG